MQLVLADDLAMVREKYIEVIEHTKDMNIHARWIYGQHPSDTLIQTYIDRKESNPSRYACIEYSSPAYV